MKYKKDEETFRSDFTNVNRSSLENIIPIKIDTLYVFIVFLIILISFKWESFGGILLIIASAYYVDFKLMNFDIILKVVLPVFVIGLLFIISSKFKKKKRKYAYNR